MAFNPAHVKLPTYAACSFARVNNDFFYYENSAVNTVMINFSFNSIDWDVKFLN